MAKNYQKVETTIDLTIHENLPPDIQLSCTYLEERCVLLEELGEVAVPEGTNQYHVLILVGVLSLQRPRHHQHRLDRPHPEVVVVLLGQLLTAQLVHLYHLLGEVLGGLETLRVKDHLSDQG